MLKEIKRLINGEISTKWLKRNGMIVGNNFHRGSMCFIDPSHCFLVNIGNNVTMSIRVTVLAHDASTEKLIGYTKIGQVIIKDNVFIGANAVILPGVIIGENSIIGAGSIVSKSIPDNVVAAGNPAKPICTLDEYKKRNVHKLKKSKMFSEKYTMRNNVSNQMKLEIIQDTTGKISYIK